MSHLNSRILCVGDDPAIREHLVREMQRFGIYSLVVSSGREALRIAGSEPVDVCVLSSRMSDMNGEKLAGELRRLAPKIPLVMTSGERSVARTALKLVDCFVAKDAGFERRLVSEVISLLGGRSRAASV